MPQLTLFYVLALYNALNCNVYLQNPHILFCTLKYFRQSGNNLIFFSRCQFSTKISESVREPTWDRTNYGILLSLVRCHDVVSDLYQ